jgi:hypothetical protein
VIHLLTGYMLPVSKCIAQDMLAAAHACLGIVILVKLADLQQSSCSKCIQFLQFSVSACTCCSHYSGLSVSELFEVPSHCVRVLFLRCDSLRHSLQDEATCFLATIESCQDVVHVVDGASPSTVTNSLRSGAHVLSKKLHNLPV